MIDSTTRTEQPHSVQYTQYNEYGHQDRNTQNTKRKNGTYSIPRHQVSGSGVGKIAKNATADHALYKYKVINTTLYHGSNLVRDVCIQLKIRTVSSR